MSDKIESRKVALGYASMMALAAWRVIEIDGQRVDPSLVAEMNAALAAGEASFGIYIQRTGNNLYISATAVPARLQDPFTSDTRLVLEGPMILSRDQLDALAPLDPKTFN